ncbi:MAG TPA: hypothetical protein VFK05_21070 [Polyangiaceae bacterium]|nr:hypothetical protein [Polyangiaceae bacterium]
MIGSLVISRTRTLRRVLGQRTLCEAMHCVCVDIQLPVSACMRHFILELNPLFAGNEGIGGSGAYENRGPDRVDVRRCGRGELAVETHDHSQTGAAARELECSEPTKAKPDCRKACTVDAWPRSERGKRFARANSQHRRLGDESRDDFDTMLAASELLAKEIRHEGNVPERRKSSCALPFMLTDARSPMQDQNARTDVGSCGLFRLDY